MFYESHNGYQPGRVMGYHTSCPSVTSGIRPLPFTTTDGVWNRPAFVFFAMDKGEEGEEGGKVSDVHCEHWRRV